MLRFTLTRELARLTVLVVVPGMRGVPVPVMEVVDVVTVLHRLVSTPSPVHMLVIAVVLAMVHVGRHFEPPEPNVSDRSRVRSS